MQEAVSGGLEGRSVGLLNAVECWLLVASRRSEGRAMRFDVQELNKSSTSAGLELSRKYKTECHPPLLDAGDVRRGLL